MPVISSSNFKVRLPSGRAAVYSIDRCPDKDGAALIQHLREFGTQIAHEFAGNWYEPGGWAMITDVRRLALIDRCPEAEKPLL